MKKTIIAVLAALMLLSAAAFAQVSVNGSYEFTRLYVDGQVVNSAPGWNAGLNIPVYKSFGLLTQFSGTSATFGKSSVALNTFGEGVQYQPLKGKFLRPYVNFVIADARFSTDNYSVNKLAETAGVGLDFSISKHFALRAGVEYLHATLPSATSGLNGVRPLGGITYRF